MPGVAVGSQAPARRPFFAALLEVRTRGQSRGGGRAPSRRSRRLLQRRQPRQQQPENLSRKEALPPEGAHLQRSTTMRRRSTGPESARVPRLRENLDSAKSPSRRRKGGGLTVSSPQCGQGSGLGLGHTTPAPRSPRFSLQQGSLLRSRQCWRCCYAWYDPRRELKPRFLIHDPAHRRILCTPGRGRGCLGRDSWLPTRTDERRGGMEGGMREGSSQLSKRYGAGWVLGRVRSSIHRLDSSAMVVGYSIITFLYQLCHIIATRFKANKEHRKSTVQWCVIL